MPPGELEKFFLSMDGKAFESIDDVAEISLEDPEPYETDLYDFDEGKIFESSFAIDEKEVERLYDDLQPKHGEKMKMEAFCICDGTPECAIQVIKALKKIGATNIKLRFEEVKNSDLEWMGIKFVATGIVWNTNNFRRLHGVPMKRRKK